MDIEQIRAETPGTDNVIHFNNAGASLMTSSTYETINEYLHEELLHGGYETAKKQKAELEATYTSVAELINAEKNEIAILENATAAWNMAFFSIDFEAGDRILTSKAEYASNYLGYLKLQKQVDVDIEVIPSDKSGETSVRALESLMDEQVKLISITHMPTNSGLVNPAESIGNIANKHDCYYLVDACQSAGHYPLDVEKIGCDMLSATGRKYLRGPRGTGFLYVNSDVLNHLTPPFLDLHAAEWTDKDKFNIRDDARRFENWEFNYATVLGLKHAVDYALELGITNIWERITNLGEKFRDKLSKISGISVQDIGTTKSGIVTFTAHSISPNVLQEKLGQHNINVNTSSKSSTLIDMQERNLDEVVRASLHYYNTEHEITRFVEVLQAILREA